MKRILAVLLSLSLIFPFAAPAFTVLAAELTAQSENAAGEGMPDGSAAAETLSETVGEAPEEATEEAAGEAEPEAPAFELPEGELGKALQNLISLSPELLRVLLKTDAFKKCLNKYFLDHPENIKKLIAEHYKAGSPAPAVEGASEERTPEEKLNKIKAAFGSFFTEDMPAFALDLTGESGTGGIKIKLDWLAEVFSALGISGRIDGAQVSVFHLLDSPDAVEKVRNRAVQGGYFVPGDTAKASFTEELSASEDGKVYYSRQYVALGADGSFTFRADSFSTFFFTVDFGYLGAEVSIGGGESVLLSELFEGLNIDREISGVKNVEFVGGDEITVTREQDDWRLYCKKSFTDVRTLRVTFADDSVIAIRVTDPTAELRYYLDGTRWCQATRQETISDEPRVVNAEPISGGSGTTTTIYARPEMAIEFESGVRLNRGTDWTQTGSFIVLNKTYEQAKVLKVGNNIQIVVVPKGTPELVEDQLKNDHELAQRYSLVEMPVTLYNYDGKKFNDHYDKPGEGNFLAFDGNSLGEEITPPTRAGWSSGNDRQANKGAATVLMGIMDDELHGNLPKSAGQDSDFFSTEVFDGKEVYEDVGFQFIYDKTDDYYTYSSNLNHAQFFKDENKVKLYSETLAAASAVGGRTTQPLAGFYPFENIEQAFLNVPYPYFNGELPENEGKEEKYNRRDAPAWHEGSNLKDQSTADTILRAKYVMDPVPTNSVDPEKSKVDMHFGMSFELPFYLPDDRKGPNKQDFVFEFLGDDDMWVFVDDHLVLDLGGMHTPQSGSFNVTTGKVKIDNGYTVLSQANGAFKGTGANREYNNSYSDTNDYLESLSTDKTHTLRVFYLERGAGVSDCRIRFNLPLTIKNPVSVEKKAVTTDSEQLGVIPDKDYTFKIFKASDNDSKLDNEVNAPANSFNPLKGSKYTIVDADGNEQPEKTTDTDGKFKLKIGQKAVFNDIERFAEVYVVELDDNNIPDPTAELNGVDITEEITSIQDPQGYKTRAAVMPAYPLKYVFTNKLEAQKLTITKQVEGSTSVNSFAFTLKLGDSGNKILSSNIDGATISNEGVLTVQFSLEKNGSYVVENIPVGMPYTLSEIEPTGGGFGAPQYSLSVDNVIEIPFGTPFEGEIKQNGENAITVTNRQFFELVITKEIEDGKKPDESFLFHISGENGVELDVIIPADSFENGTGKVTVKHLPAGNYTVTEITSWSWRYRCEEPDKQVDLSTGTNKNEVTFENSLENDKWLSGDVWCENIWTHDGSVCEQKERGA